MEIEELGIAGAWRVTPRLFPDARGVFLEAYKARALEAVTGHRLEVAQVNVSVSDPGVVRGIHFADVPPGQAKYVTCATGAAWDVVVDLRVGSPTYGRWEGVLLDDVDRRAVYLSEGLGHGFCALAPGTAMTYLCSTAYAPAREHGVHPLDPSLAIAWPTRGRDGQPLEWELSAKDSAAPTLAAAREQGLLPDHATCQAHTASLAALSGEGAVS